MSTKIKKQYERKHQRWAEFRFSVIGGLLSSPPAKGELSERLQELADKTWQHPITGEPFTVAKSTIERWMYETKKDEGKSPVLVLQRQIRSDSGTYRVFEEPIKKEILTLYKKNSSWSYKLHYDNLKAKIEHSLPSTTVPSYPSVTRYMKANGLLRKKKPRRRDDGSLTDGAEQALNRLESREVRSYEREYVGALWHLDFHKCSRKVVVEGGIWVVPIAFCVVDDRSRLICHIQWYLAETTENMIHGCIQAIQKYGLCREWMTDNGSAMKAAEFTEGLMRLGIVHSPTIPHSPYQNGKQECLWSRLEGRLIAMLEKYKDLTLKRLNDLTQIWAIHEYNAVKHEETQEIPRDRFAQGKNVLRASPTKEHLRNVFRREMSRKQRLSDGTVSIDARRFEIPSPYRHIKDLCIRYAEWDLSYVSLIDQKTGVDLGRLYPQDKVKNAEGIRRTLESEASIPITEYEPTNELPPLLEKLVREHEKLGLPPAYIPQEKEQSDQE
jgi:putative transposase